MSSVERTSRARLDLIEIWSYIAQDNPAAADKLLRSIEDTCEILARSPQMGEKQDQYRPTLRRFVVGRYAIFYHATDDGILVYRVLHGARDLDTQF